MTNRHAPELPLALSSPSIALGGVKVTALRDGYFDLPGSFLVPSAAHPASPVPSQIHIDVNAFLVETPSHRLLIDTGCGHELGPTVNELLPNLRAAGVEPDMIDAVLCTHIHPDHTNGLVDAQGRANFKNAQIFVHQREVDFWLSDAEMSRAPEELKGQFLWAQNAFAPYSGRISPFEEGPILQHIEARSLFGHTPGHSGFLIDGGDSQLLVWGDLVHAISEQARDPSIAFAADVDQDAARETRRRTFDMLSTDRLLVSGMHLPFPGFGHVERDGATYDYVPI